MQRPAGSLDWPGQQGQRLLAPVVRQQVPLGVGKVGLGRGREEGQGQALRVAESAGVMAADSNALGPGCTSSDSWSSSGAAARY